MKKAFHFLEKQEDMAFATCDRHHNPKVRVLELMKTEGHTLYFAVSPCRRPTPSCRTTTARKRSHGKRHFPCALEGKVHFDVPTKPAGTSTTRASCCNASTPATRNWRTCALSPGEWCITTCPKPLPSKIPMISTRKTCRLHPTLPYWKTANKRNPQRIEHMLRDLSIFRRPWQDSGKPDPLCGNGTFPAGNSIPG